MPASPPAPLPPPQAIVQAPPPGAGDSLDELLRRVASLKNQA
jgi:hypothetical protein